MTKKTIKQLENYELRTLCIQENWFTGGSINQYNKLFELNESQVVEKENDLNKYIWNLSLVIWTCTPNKTLSDIQSTLILKMNKKMNEANLAKFAIETWCNPFI